jgi:hypothetical protein
MVGTGLDEFEPINLDPAAFEFDHFIAGEVIGARLRP